MQLKGATKPFSSHTFTIACATPFFFCLFFLVCLFFCLFVFLFHCYLHYVWHQLSTSFTVLMTFHYYFISLQHPWSHTFNFHLLFSFYLTLSINISHCLNYTLLILHLIIERLVNTFYNNCVITICCSFVLIS